MFRQVKRLLPWRRPLLLEPLEDRMLLASLLSTSGIPPTGSTSPLVGPRLVSNASSSTPSSSSDDDSSYGSQATSPATTAYYPPLTYQKTYTIAQTSAQNTAPGPTPAPFELPRPLAPDSRVVSATVFNTPPPQRPASNALPLAEHEPEPTVRVPPPPLVPHEVPTESGNSSPLEAARTPRDNDTATEPPVTVDVERTQPLGLPLDLPPLDLGVWSGAVERFFRDLDAFTPTEEESVLWTQMVPWGVAVGALSVSVEFARRWLETRGLDFTEFMPRGFVWKRTAAPKFPQEP